MCENFYARTYALQELNELREQGLTRGALVAFHSRYKLVLLAHSQPAYRELGRFMAEIARWSSLEDFYREYLQRLSDLLSQPATRNNHTNVLMHVQGYFRPYLSSSQRQALATVIDDYRQGTQPLLAPVTLIQHYISEFPDAYLSSQRYFEFWSLYDEH